DVRCHAFKSNRQRSASKCQGKWPDQTLDQAFGLPEVLVAVSASRLSCKRAGKTRTLMPVWDSSGEISAKTRELGFATMVLVLLSISNNGIGTFGAFATMVAKQR